MDPVNLNLLPWKSPVVCDENYVIFKEGSDLIAVPKYKDKLYLKECFEVLINEGNNKRHSTGGCLDFKITYSSKKLVGQEFEWPCILLQFE